MTKEHNNHPITVAFVINDFLVGGVQRLHVELFKRLDRKRFRPVLITLFDFSDSGRDTLYAELPADVRVYRHSFKSGWDIGEWFSLMKTLKTLQPDVVVSNLFLSNLITRVLKPFFGYAVLIAEHNTYVHKTPFEIFLDRLLSRITFSIIAVSDSVKRFTARQERIPLFKFTVIPNGIDVAAIEDKLSSYNLEQIRNEFGNDKKFIVSVARLSPQKNHKLLIDGFSLFAQTNSAYDLLLVGGGGMFKELQHYITKQECADHVHLLGSQFDVYKYYAMSDFFVSTSTIEGFGIAHAEALACGLPLLSTKTAGPDEMIAEGKNGYFIHEEAPGAVAAGMEKMVAELEELRQHTKEVARRYDIAKTVHAYEELIAKAASA